MLLHIVARGKIGRSPEAEIIDRYTARIAWSFRITELPEQGGKLADSRGRLKTVLLDERGRDMASTTVADVLSDWRDDGVGEVRFMIGGADGFDDAIRTAADDVWSFGKATWPHLLVRAMLVEQLYRATTIVAGHPYHREG